MKAQGTNQDGRSSGASIPLTEWIVAAIGCFLVISSFAFLAFRAVSEREPPSFDFVVEEVNSKALPNSVTVSVRNRGGAPVADLLVRAIRDHQESREVIVDHVPAKSSRRVTFVFSATTGAEQLAFAIESFREP
jgi:uncharacterized protein (TIGR02588 family)